mgnify:CR=1 FL=1
MSSLSIIRIRFLGPLVPASVKVGRGKVYRADKYRQYVETLAWLIKEQWSYGPDKGGWGVKAKIWSSTGDWENHIKPVCDAGKGILYLDDRQVRKAEVELIRRGPGTIEVEFYRLAIDLPASTTRNTGVGQKIDLTAYSYPMDGYL